MGASLTYDHVNYLIWRYLQERGYGKTAIQLQREWNNSEPNALPFTPAVEPYFLIQMLQDALAYDRFVVEARRAQHDMSHDTENTANEEENTQAIRDKKFGSLRDRYAFVNLTQRRPSRLEDAQGGIDEFDRSVKRPRIDPIRRKPLRSTSDAHVNGDAMDVDDEDRHGDAADESVDEAPLKEEPPPLEYTLDKGHSIGFQTEDIKDAEQHANLVASHSVPGADIFGIKWSEEDDDKITISGGCAWHSLNINAEAQPNGISQNGDYEMHEPAQEPIAVNITAQPEFCPDEYLKIQKFAVSQADVAVNSSGTKLVAQAIEELEDSGCLFGHVNLRIGKDEELRELDSSEMTVVALRFSPSADLLLGVFQSEISNKDHDGETVRCGSIRIWEINDSDVCGDVVCESIISDVAWIDDSSFVVCGNKFLGIFAKEQETTNFDFKRSVETEREWDQLRYDPETRQLACLTGVDGHVGLLDLAADEFVVHSAHDETITALRWQPRIQKAKHRDPEADGDEEMGEAVAVDSRMLATSSTDGTVKLWETRPSWSCLFTFVAKIPDPVWSIEFSRDGKLLAAACERQLTIWNAVPESPIVATFRTEKPEGEESRGREGQGEQASPKMNGNTDRAGHSDSNEHGDGNERHSSAGDVEMMETDPSEDGIPPDYCLAWDQHGKRIAQALGDTVSIIALPAS